MGDLILFLILNAIVAMAIVLGHLGRGLGASPRVMRRLVHFVTGFWPLLWPLFRSHHWALFTVTLWAVLLTLLASWPRFSRRLMLPFTFEGAWLWGSVSYAWTLVLVTLFLWGERTLAAASILAMAAGDPVAEAIGERWGKHHFHIPWCSQRTYEGTGAGFLGTSAGIFIALWACGAPIKPLPLLAAGVAGALAEAFSPAYLDNLTMTAAVALVLWGLG